jgi:uncharacterized membrane protein
MVPQRDVVELNMTVDEGLKMLISMGAIVPHWQVPAPPVAPPVVNP